MGNLPQGTRNDSIEVRVTLEFGVRESQTPVNGLLELAQGLFKLPNLLAV